MARGIWKGTLGFGLVNIGVELFTAESARGLDLDLLDARDHAPVGYRKYNKVTGAEIAGEDIVKGYAVSKGQYVILSNEDLTAASPRKSQSIDVVGFVPAADIPLVYFDKPYVIGPLKGSEKAYALFVDTLTDLQQVGIGQVVIRTKQHMAAIFPFENALVAQLLRYHDEVRLPSQLGIERGETQRAQIRDPERTMARQLVEMMSTTWQPEQFRDTYRDDLMKLIEERAAGSTVQSAATASDDPAPRVLDLMAALKGSLAARARDRVSGDKPGAGKRSGTARPPAKRAAEKSSEDDSPRDAKVVKPVRKVAASAKRSTTRSRKAG